MSPVFINCTAETFTPTKSGAIATWIWEVCNAAKQDGIEPLVITRSTNDTEAYKWDKTALIVYPEIPRIRGAGRLFEMQRRLQGWGHPRQKIYLGRVVHEIETANAQSGPFVLQNDIEMAVYLKERFPKAFLLHHAHNDNGVKSERFRRRFRNAPNVATACSNWTCAWNASYYGFFRGEIKTIYNGVNVESYKPLSQFEDRAPVINYHGRIDEHKAPDLLLKAALRLSRETTNFSVQIVGRKYYWMDQLDGYQQLLMELTEQLQSKGVEVSFRGWIDRYALPSVLQQADIHVTTSRWNEPFGLTTLEAMATGLATIGSNTGGTPEVIGDAGLLFERDNVEQLAAHLLALVQDPALRQEMGRRARLRALKFTWRDTWNALNALLPG